MALIYGSPLKDFAKTEQILANAVEVNKMFENNHEDKVADQSSYNLDEIIAKQLEEERRSGLFDGCDKRFIKSYEAAYAKKFREGFEKGRREVRLEVASNMLKYGADTDFIKKYTHLSDEEIAGLRK